MRASSQPDQAEATARILDRLAEEIAEAASLVRVAGREQRLRSQADAVG